jgi:hypothetical protein
MVATGCAEAAACPRRTSPSGRAPEPSSRSRSWQASRRTPRRAARQPPPSWSNRCRKDRLIGHRGTVLGSQSQCSSWRGRLGERSWATGRRRVGNLGLGMVWHPAPAFSACCAAAFVASWRSRRLRSRRRRRACRRWSWSSPPCLTLAVAGLLTAYCAARPRSSRNRRRRWRVARPPRPGGLGATPRRLPGHHASLIPLLSLLSACRHITSHGRQHHNQHRTTITVFLMIPSPFIPALDPSNVAPGSMSQRSP